MCKKFWLFRSVVKFGQCTFVYYVQVLLVRESKTCTDFKNLKTLSLGEWCITPDLDVLADMLQRSPNLENLSVHLDMVRIKL